MRKTFSCILLFCYLFSRAQDSVHALAPATSVKSSNYQGRKLLAGALSLGGYGGSFIFLSQAWYKAYPRSSFHSFDDSGEWQQMDKIGHAWTAFQTSRATTKLWQWAGVKPNTAVVLGTGSSLLYMLSIEYLDGRSAEWGWSWSDAGADLFGGALFAAQHFAWKEEKINLKFSSHYKKYNPQSLQARADNLFGSSLPERLLKDYNAQTYWLSANLQTLLHSDKIPAWLNISLGYGADGMYGGYENIAFDKNGNLVFDRRDIKRYRQFYLAPDVDLTKIKTGSKLLHTVFFTLNSIKFPAPALELSNGKLKLKGVAF